MDLVAFVPADLADLIAGYLQNRAQDIEKLKSALADGDFATLQRLGESMYALGNPYGFRQITTFGRLIREACAAHDDVSMRQVLLQYEDYLAKVSITVVPEAVQRVPWKSARPPWAMDENAPSTSSPRSEDKNHDEESSDQRQRRQ
jgi:hypothetical protein